MIIGYWIAEKKRQKFNWPELERMCENEGIILKPVSTNWKNRIFKIIVLAKKSL